MPENLTASELFLKGIEQISKAFRPGKQGKSEPPLQAAEAIRQSQAEHEERRRRIAKTIASGARLSRERDL